MLTYRDFAPQPLSSTIERNPRFEPFDVAVQAANDWIAAESIEIVNVETVVLPSYSAWVEGKTTDPHIYVNLANYWFASRQFVRVWYRSRKD
jgi:hypothetical protein